MRTWIVLPLLLFTLMPAFGQKAEKITRDTIFLEQQDTVLIQSYAKRYNPRKALLYAAVAPGLGQIYNKKYWKLPLVYGGFYLLIRQTNIFNKGYVKYKNHLFYNLENQLPESKPNPDVSLTTPQLRKIVDKARRERDFWLIMVGGMYILQMVDAHVDSHLKEFDLNPNLKVKVEPTMTNDAWVGRQTGVAVTFRF